MERGLQSAWALAAVGSRTEVRAPCFLPSIVPSHPQMDGGTVHAAINFGAAGAHPCQKPGGRHFLRSG